MTVIVKGSLAIGELHRLERFLILSGEGGVWPEGPM